MIKRSYKGKHQAVKNLVLFSCFAVGKGTPVVTQPLENLKTFVIAVIGAAGVMMAGVSTVLTFLGF
ncbi:hypothetical protein [Kineothrix sp. MB12-C1]|uniref:hypothetical protein n=1 Tax=Kineothrix sp. MB12-C1 TaxID=3070215 RepID=UPI003FA56BD4